MAMVSGITALTNQRPVFRGQPNAQRLSSPPVGHDEVRFSKGLKPGGPTVLWATCALFLAACFASPFTGWTNYPFNMGPGHTYLDDVQAVREQGWRALLPNALIGNKPAADKKAE